MATVDSDERIRMKAQDRCIKMVTDQQSSCETIRLVGSKDEKSFNINQTMDNSTFGDQEISQKYHNSSVTAYR